MHIFGKILIGLIIPTAIGAIALMSHLIVVRNTWTKRVAQLTTSNEKNAEGIASRERELKALRAEWNVAVLEWDQYWKEIPTKAHPDKPASLIATELGTNAGLVPIEGGETGLLPALFGFQPIGNNEYRYVGQFQADTVQPDRSGFTATWKPRSGEVDRWKAPDAKWRWRRRIPSSYFERFSDLQYNLNNADQIMNEREGNLVIQTELLESADQRVKFRLQDLGVDPEKPEITGLVEAVQEADEQRNAELDELDRLRRSLDAEILRRDALSEENRKLSKGLPQPKPNLATKETQKK